MAERKSYTHSIVFSFVIFFQSWLFAKERLYSLELFINNVYKQILGLERIRIMLLELETLMRDQLESHVKFSIDYPFSLRWVLWLDDNWNFIRWFDASHIKKLWTLKVLLKNKTHFINFSNTTYLQKIHYISQRY